MTENAAKPRVYVIGTGGTLSCIGTSRTDFINHHHRTKALTIQELLARVPEIHEFAEIRAEQFTNTRSADLGPSHWLALAKRVNEIFRTDPDAAGVAITHGTGTLEETAYFLNLTVKTRKPVVVTGAMRAPTALSTDTDLNLIDCVRVASDTSAGNKGVLVVMNNEIQAARDVTKANSLRVHTMSCRDLGGLGYADSDGQLVFYRAPTRKHTLDAEFDIENVAALPRVEIAYAYAGADGFVVRALADAGVSGIVSAGFGSGNAPEEYSAVLRDVQKRGLKVVVATQCGDGRVPRKLQHIEDDLIVADNLAPRKARILLMLALTKTRDSDEIQAIMATY